MKKEGAKNPQMPEWCPDTCPMRIGTKGSICSLQQMKLKGIAPSSRVLQKERDRLTQQTEKMIPQDIILWCTQFEGNGL